MYYLPTYTKKNIQAIQVFERSIQRTSKYLSKNKANRDRNQNGPVTNCK